MSDVFEWQEPRFAVAGEDAGLSGLTWPDADPTWDGALPCLEENLETLLMFHLAELTGVELTPRRRGWVMEPGQDLVASDRLGRIHLFELKKGSVGPRDCDQLEHYLLKQLFADRDAFLAEADTQFRNQVDPLSTARNIAGAMAAERGDITGLRLAQRWLPPEHALLQHAGRRLTAYRYSKFTTEEQRRFAVEVLLERAVTRGLVSPQSLQFAQVLAHGEAWSTRLLAPPPAPLASPMHPMVLWLIGRRIGSGALERVRRWRAAGVDVRVLELQVWRHSRGWLCAVRREDAPARNRLEIALTQHLAERATPPKLRLDLYERVNPSASKTTGGGILITPIATLDGQPVVLEDPISAS
jgi:hypothetical protein